VNWNLGPQAASQAVAELGHAIPARTRFFKKPIPDQHIGKIVSLKFVPRLGTRFVDDATVRIRLRLQAGRMSRRIGALYAKPTHPVFLLRHCRALCREKLKPSRNGLRHVAEKLSHRTVPFGHQHLDSRELPDAKTIDSIARTCSEDSLRDCGPRTRYTTVERAESALIAPISPASCDFSVSRDQCTRWVI
jgi:hypothetical protein